MARYHIETYGCTANRGESRTIERRLRDAGHREAPLEIADVAILNTCTVVEKTEQNMLRRAESLARTAPELVVTGCMALAQGEAFEEAGIDARICHWDDVPVAVRNGECPTPGTTGATASQVSSDGPTADAGSGESDAAALSGDEPAQPVLDGVIGILPIARGCMSNCSYCITKHATGRIDSPPVDTNVRRARELLKSGAKELRVTGQDTGVYGWDTGERKLPELLDRICALPGEFRVRVGMANPGGVHGIRDELAAVFARHDELYNFLHAPVQSGSDDVLADMRRQHRTEMFRDIVDTFDEQLEHWTLATDFIAGFPTETESDHRQSVALLREVAPERINITRFSKRPGTDAADLQGLGGQVKKNRSKELTDAKMEVVTGAYEGMIGESHTVIAVEQGTGDSIKCRDEAYRQLILPGSSANGVEPGSILDVRVTDNESVYGYAEPV